LSNRITGASLATGAQKGSASRGRWLTLKVGAFNDDYNVFGWETSSLPDLRWKVPAALRTAHSSGRVHKIQMQMQKTMMTSHSRFP
jgi:hypothetical protein